MSKNNGGYNSKAIKTLNVFEIDGEPFELKEFWDIDKDIRNLISLSKAGNN